MTSALRSLALVTVIVLICLGGTWLFLKAKASSEPAPKPVSSKFFSGLPKYLLIADVNKMLPDEINALPQTTVFFIDVQVSRDRRAIVSSVTEFKNPNFNPDSPDRSPETKLQRLQTRYMNYSDIKKSDSKAQLLTDVLKSDPNRKFVLNVIDYPEEADSVLSEAVSSAHADERIIFQSVQDGPLSDLRKLKPMWLFGTSRAQIVQTLWLAKLGLSAIAPLKGDVLISTLYSTETRQKTLLMNPDLLAEARRRSMKVLIGPVQPSDFDEVRKLGADGIITPKPAEFGFPQL